MSASDTAAAAAKSAPANPLVCLVLVVPIALYGLGIRRKPEHRTQTDNLISLPQTPVRR